MSKNSENIDTPKDNSKETENYRESVECLISLVFGIIFLVSGNFEMDSNIINYISTSFSGILSLSSIFGTLVFLKKLIFTSKLEAMDALYIEEDALKIPRNSKQWRIKNLEDSIKELDNIIQKLNSAEYRRGLITYFMQNLIAIKNEMLERKYEKGTLTGKDKVEVVEEDAETDKEEGIEESTVKDKDIIEESTRKDKFNLENPSNQNATTDMVGEANNRHPEFDYIQHLSFSYARHAMMTKFKRIVEMNEMEKKGEVDEEIYRIELYFLKKLVENLQSALKRLFIWFLVFSLILIVLVIISIHYLIQKTDGYIFKIVDITLICFSTTGIYCVLIVLVFAKHHPVIKNNQGLFFEGNFTLIGSVKTSVPLYYNVILFSIIIGLYGVVSFEKRHYDRKYRCIVVKRIGINAKEMMHIKRLIYGYNADQIV
ncbi:14678_t:CDS:2 [Acaulospora morrowiae]|uniref:14678_t:CDS:1 n=1 Tax=Acaulospora morrowiae TaxID=94023 RepID=A0A9N8ZFB8_9GLOM|nr:14678_t:CDS:2 [Acaulospora morrowiae]